MAAMHILLVEDDPEVAESTARALRSQGWGVDISERGEPVPHSVRQDPYDLVVLDVGLPGIDGFETLRRIRALNLRTPVLMLTARDAVDDRVRGLESGADDYVVKPFALAELLARAKALVRRATQRESDTLQLGGLVMDLEAKRAAIQGQVIELSAREWAVLEFILSRAGKVVGKDKIIQSLAGWDEPMSDNAVEVHVSRLRAKIEPAGLRIRTIRGLGYLVEEVAHGTPP